MAFIQHIDCIYELLSLQMASMFTTYLVLLIQFRQSGPGAGIDGNRNLNTTLLHAMGNITTRWERKWYASNVDGAQFVL